MTDVTRRRTGELLRKLFEILMPHTDGMLGRDALGVLQNEMEFTEYELGHYDREPNKPRFEIIVRFATVDCVKAGWLVKQKGRWSVTEEGRTAYKDYSDPEAFYQRATKLYREWKHSRNIAGAEDVDDARADGAEEGSDEKSVSITFEQAEEQAWGEIQQYLTGMNPYDLQELVAALLRAMGYHVAWVSPPGKDGGIDILAWSDPLGTRPPRIKVQVKRHIQKIPVDGLRSFMALLGDDDVGIFVTTGGFTKDAEDEARTQEKRKITLIDLERLFDLWVEYYDRLDESARLYLPLKPIYFLAPES